MRILRVLVVAAASCLPPLLMMTLVMPRVWPGDPSGLVVAYPAILGMSLGARSDSVRDSLRFAIAGSVIFAGLMPVLNVVLAMAFDRDLSSLSHGDQVAWFLVGLLLLAIGIAGGESYLRSTRNLRRLATEKRREAAREEGSRNAAEFIASLHLPDDQRETRGP